MDDGIIDSDFIGLAICDVLDLRGLELLPEIKRLFDLGYVSKGICGDLNAVEKELFEPEKDFLKRNSLIYLTGTMKSLQPGMVIPGKTNLSVPDMSR